MYLHRTHFSGKVCHILNFKVIWFPHFFLYHYYYIIKKHSFDLGGDTYWIWVTIKEPGEMPVDLPNLKRSLTTRAHRISTDSHFRNFQSLNALHAPQTDRGEANIASMMFAHAGLPKRLVLYLVLRGTLWTLITTYKHQTRFTHVKVMFLATCAQAVFFLPGQSQASASQQTYLSLE